MTKWSDAPAWLVPLLDERDWVAWESFRAALRERRIDVASLGAVFDGEDPARPTALDIRDPAYRIVGIDWDREDAMQRAFVDLVREINTAGGRPPLG